MFDADNTDLELKRISCIVVAIDLPLLTMSPEERQQSRKQLRQQRRYTTDATQTTNSSRPQASVDVDVNDNDDIDDEDDGDDDADDDDVEALFPNEHSSVAFRKLIERTIGYDVLLSTTSYDVSNSNAAQRAKTAILAPIVDPIAKLAIESICDVQSFRVKHPKRRTDNRNKNIDNDDNVYRSNDDDWLSVLFDLSNGNKHIELAQHVHSATLNERAYGSIEVCERSRGSRRGECRDEGAKK